MVFDVCELEVTYLTLSEGSLLSLRHRLSQGPLWYPYLRSTLFGPMMIPAGSREVNLSVCRGLVPEACLVAIQPVALSAANYAINCYEFSPSGSIFAQVNLMESSENLIKGIHLDELWRNILADARLRVRSRHRARAWRHVRRICGVYAKHESRSGSHHDLRGVDWWNVFHSFLVSRKRM